MSNYAVWDAGMLTERWLELRRRLGRAKDREQLLSIWGEIEVVERELEDRLFVKAESDERNAE